MRIVLGCLAVIVCVACAWFAFLKSSSTDALRHQAEHTVENQPERGDDQRPQTPSLDAVGFETIGFKFQGEPKPGEVRGWVTPDGDGLGLYYFSLPPDLPPDATSVDQLAGFYRGLVAEAGGELVELQVEDIDGVQAVHMILSASQQDSGRTYIGSLTIPFRDCSFVLKCQCIESAPTGLKAALLMDRRLQELASAPDNGRTSEIQDINLDDPSHDATFPDAPVARVRRVLAHLKRTVSISAGVKKLPRFSLPKS